MLIAHVEFRVAEADKPAALELLINEAKVARTLPGNVKFQAFLNPEQTGTVEIIHEWESADSFAGYLSSDSFKAIGAALGPKMMAPPVSKRFLAEPVDA